MTGELGSPRTWPRVAVGAVGAATASGAAVAGLLAWSSRGTPRQVLDGAGNPLAGSISEKVRVPINGVEQGMFIRAADASRPLLLFLHGGPGMPEYFLDRTHPTGLEHDFVVCWWEQRGSGLSYRPGMPGAALTVEQLISDTIAVSKYLRERFDQERIHLMGHSWGSFLGIQVAARAPELFSAYIGMGQVSKGLPVNNTLLW